MGREKGLRKNDEEVVKRHEKDRGKKRNKHKGSTSKRRRVENDKGKMKVHVLTDSSSESESSSIREKVGKRKKNYKRRDSSSSSGGAVSVRKLARSKVVPEKKRTLEPTNGFGHLKVRPKSTYYKSNFRTTIKELSEVGFKQNHIESIKRTPVWLLVNAILRSNSEMLMKRCLKHEDDIRDILLRFDKDSERFMIGEGLLPLSSRDVQLILGICGGSECILISTKRSDFEMPKWVERCFSREIEEYSGGSYTLYKSRFYNKLVEMIEYGDATSVQDVARLTTAYLLASLLATHQNGGISWQLASYLDDFDNMCKYNWSSFIASMLKSQIVGSANLRAGGCIMLLPFWFCEHISLIEPDDEDAFPRFLKWNLNKLHKKFGRFDLSELDSRYIRRIDLKATAYEKDTLAAALKFVEEERPPQRSLNSSPSRQRGAEYEAEGDTGAGEESDAREQNSGTPDDVEQNDEKVHTQTDDVVQSDDAVQTIGIATACDVTPTPVKSSRTTSKVGTDDDDRTGDVERDVTVNCLKYDVQCLQVQIEEFKKTIDEKDCEVSRLKCKELELEQKEYYIKKMGEAAAREKDTFDAELRKKDEEISQLRWENEELLKRVKELTAPTATQLYEDPETMARIELAEELHLTKQKNEVLEKENASLEEKLDNSPLVMRKKRSAPKLTPGTLVRLVKNRTAIEDRKKMEITPQLNTKELVLFHDNACEEKKDNKKREREHDNKKNAHKPLILNNTYWAVKKTTEKVKGIASGHWENDGPGYVVWSGEGPYSSVTLENIVSILHHDRYPDSVVDSWGAILLETYAERHVSQKVTIFTAICWGLISGVRHCSSGTKRVLIDKLIESSANKDRLIFPLLTEDGGSARRSMGDHWTLLDFNMKKLEWKFYNSMPPRRKDGKDPYLTKAAIVVDYVEKTLRQILKEKNPDHPAVSGEFSKPVAADCPKQASDSVDCGVIVCQNIENLVQGKKIKGGEFTYRMAGNYRAKMAEWFTDSINIGAK